LTDIDLMPPGIHAPEPDPFDIRDAAESASFAAWLAAKETQAMSVLDDPCTHGGDCPVHPDANGIHGYGTPRDFAAALDELTKAIQCHAGDVPADVVIAFNPAGDVTHWSVRFVARERGSGRVWQRAYGVTLLAALRNARAYQIHRHSRQLIDLLAPDDDCPWPASECRHLEPPADRTDWAGHAQHGAQRFRQIDAVAAAVEMQDLRDAAAWHERRVQDDEREDTGL
jgi:hypothetical protein